MGLAAVGIALTAGAAVLGGIQQYNMAKFQEELANRNAQIAQDNAARAIQRSQVEQQDQDMITLAFLGEQEAIQAASGLGGRSQALARKSAAELGRRDALNVRQAGEIEAYNFQTQAMNFQAEASQARSAAGFGLLSGFMGAAQSLVGRSTSVRDPGRFSPSGLRQAPRVTT